MGYINGPMLKLPDRGEWFAVVRVPANEGEAEIQGYVSICNPVAAPDLLEALEAVMADADLRGRMLGEAYHLVTDAIAKARGTA